MTGDGKQKYIKASSSGQAMIFLLVVLVILSFVAMWNYDLHRILFIKSATQNAGDSAALMAARWQGVSLNLIGDLNIINAIAISEEDSETSSSISNIQARLCFTGPMIAFAAAQQAAKNNGIYNNDDFEKLLRQHADMVRYEYTEETPEGDMLFIEPYPDCWEEYADMLIAIANAGVAAGPENARLFGDRIDGHILLMMEFYQAIAGQNWCWFYNNEGTLLEGYSDFSYWSPLPEVGHSQPLNSEIFGLGMSKRESSMLSNLYPDHQELMDMMNTISGERELGGTVTTNAMVTNATWYCYRTSKWEEWTAFSSDSPINFPAIGTVKAQYNYTGADAAIVIETRAKRLTPKVVAVRSDGTKDLAEIQNNIKWTAAAKPFGYLNEEDRPCDYTLVLPAFHEVRLVPLDTSSAPAGGGYDLGWRTHIEDHLENDNTTFPDSLDYITDGPEVIISQRPDCASCSYCQALLTWENEYFRQIGVDWLAENSALCTLPGRGGGGPGGGSRRGH